MKKFRWLSIFASFLIIFYSCSPQLAPVGHFQDNTVTADGNTDDWELPLRFSNPQHTFDYSITNDKNNIYICITSNDDRTEIRMLRSGLTIYFDPKGNKNKNISLEFPVKKPEQPSYNNSYNNTDPIKSSSNKEIKDQLLLESNFFNTKGFANIENGQFAVGNQKINLQVALKLHNDSSNHSLVYEAIIPINDIPGVNQYARNTGKNFSIGIAMTSSQNRSNNNNYSPRPSFGMRGMRMGGGGYRNYNNQYQEPKEEINWYLFRLAYNKN